MKPPSFFRLFTPSLPRLKASVPILLGIAWCVALFWIWWWGPGWQVMEKHPLAPHVNRWLATAIMLLIAIGWVGWKVYQRLQHLERLQREARQEHKDPLAIAVQYQQHFLDRWLVALKRHQNSSTYLYQLPWYLALGSESSGTQTLLTQGNKLSPLYRPDPDNVADAPPLLVESWVGEQAVIIAPDGKLVNQSTLDAEGQGNLYPRLWQGLLAWLVANRSRQPLNGIIISVDIHQFATFTREQREQYLATLCQRLQDVSKTTENRLPMYVVLTKLDLLYGFESLFQGISKTQRESILGVTFTLDSKYHNWQDELENFWQQWMKQLNAAMPDMMLSQVDAGQRSQLFTFIRQLSGLKDYVLELLNGMLFDADKRQQLLRGVYLTSSCQKGQMEDLFVQSASVQYHLGLQAYPTWQSPLSVPYFTQKLFSQVIFAEPNLAGESHLFRRLHRQQLLTFSVIGGIVALALLFGWSHYYRINDEAGQEVLAQAKTFMSIKTPEGVDLYGNLQLPLLNPIRDATLAYGDYHDRNPVLADMGLYQGSRIGPYVENSYLQLLQQHYLPALMSGLLQELNSAPPNSEQKLEILRIMRMLEDGSRRNKPMILQYMQQRWSERFKGQRELQDQLVSHLDYALDHTDWHQSQLNGNQQAITRFAPFVQPIKAAQLELSKLSIYRRVYQNLRQKAHDTLPPDLSLREQIGPSFDTVFVLTDEKRQYVPQFLTRSGLNNYFVKQNDQLVDLTALDSWVLNLTQNVHYSEADRQEIQRQITEQYFSDYITTWHAGIGNIEMQTFVDLPQITAALEQIISGEQPFKRALQILRDNTQPPALTGQLKGSELQQALDQPSYQLMTRIHHEFAPSTVALDENGDRVGMLQNVYQKLTDLHRYLLAIQNAPAPGKAAIKALQIRLDQNTTDPIFEVQQLAKTLPDPLNRWVGSLAEQAWRVVMMQTVQSLEVEWNEKVVSVYQNTLANRYPFNPKATQDVALSDFERFFAPNGILDSFYQQNLKPLVDNKLTADDNQPLLRNDVLQQLQRAQRIRETFFSGQNGMGAQFAVQPLELSANKRRSVLNLDGQLLDFSHGPANRVRLVWPNSMRAGVESKITLVPDTVNVSPRSQSFTGPWAQMHLVDAGHITNNGDGAFDIRFTLDGGDMTYRFYVDDADNPFAPGLFSQFSLPQTLY